MTAQLATSTILAYGPQGAQQSATAVLLSYTPHVSAQRVVASFGVPWARAEPRALETHAPMHLTDALDEHIHSRWGQGDQRQQQSRASWSRRSVQDRERNAPWRTFARRLQTQSAQPWVVSRKSDADARAPWGEFAGRPAINAAASWVRATVSDRQNTGPWGQFAGRPVLTLRPGWATASRADAERWIPWVRFGRPLNAGWGVVVPDGNPPTDEHGTVLVPIRRVSIVINTITLHRVDTGAQLRAHAFNASLDFGSWTWSWSASLHHDVEGLLGRDSAGDTAELQAVINGVPLRLRLESVELDERFLPQKRWAVSGQGKSSILGDSRAPILSFGNAVDRTAQQLAADALTINGVGIGWSLDWGIADWLVPAGAWALQGRYIDAINDIAAAAGGYVQPHPTDAVLRVLPRYPVPPWEWDSVTPDFEIPRGAAEVVGTKFVDKPAYNGVYVGGESVGVYGPFKRTGTDGAVLAPPVNHALITHADAHRARGIAEISDTGAQEHVTLSMQILPETGLVVPGQFVRYVRDRTVMGIVRRTSIDLNRPKLRQTIAIETHVAD